MPLIAFPVLGKQKSEDLCNAFIQGAPRDAVGSVFYGVKAGNHADWLRVKSKGHDYYVIDNAYFDQTRGRRFRVTRNRLQHTGEGETDGERFRALGIELQPWRPKDGPGYVLLCPQSYEHMHYMVGYQGDWLLDAMDTFCRDQECKVREWNPDKLKLSRTLAADLEGASCMITHTSAAAVAATVAGVPVICNQQCAAFGMYGRDRLRWAGVLADNEFTMDELKDGTAWRTLNP